MEFLSLNLHDYCLPARLLQAKRHRPKARPKRLSELNGPCNSHVRYDPERLDKNIIKVEIILIIANLNATYNLQI